MLLNIKLLKNLYNILKNFFHNKNIKLVLVCSPTNTHLEYIKFLKEKEINYLVEKPIIKDDQLKDLNKFINKKSKNIELVGYQLRYNKILLKIETVIIKKNCG